MDIKGSRHIIAALVITLIGLWIVGCAAPPSAPPPPSPTAETKAVPTQPSKQETKTQHVKIQLPARGAYLLPFLLGREKGQYKEEGIDLEIIVMKAPLAVPALVGGEIDYSSVGTSIFNAGQQGLPVKVVMNMTQKPIWHIFGGPGINSAEDLRGKNVALTSIGAAEHYAAKEALRYLKLDPDKDVTFVAIPDAATKLAALKARSVSGMAADSPWNQLALDEGFKDLVFTGDVMDLPSNGLSTGDRKLKENPDQVKRMIKATLKSIAFMKSQRDQTVELLMKEFQLERRLAMASYEDITKATSSNGAISENAHRPWIDMGKASGAIRGDVVWEKSIDTTQLKAAQKELNLAP